MAVRSRVSIGIVATMFVGATLTAIHAPSASAGTRPEATCYQSGTENGVRMVTRLEVGYGSEFHKVRGWIRINAPAGTQVNADMYAVNGTTSIILNDSKNNSVVVSGWRSHTENLTMTTNTYVSYKKPGMMTADGFRLKATCVLKYKW